MKPNRNKGKVIQRIKKNIKNDLKACFIHYELETHGRKV